MRDRNYPPTRMGPVAAFLIVAAVAGAVSGGIAGGLIASSWQPKPQAGRRSVAPPAASPIVPPVAPPVAARPLPPQIDYADLRRLTDLVEAAAKGPTEDGRTYTVAVEDSTWKRTGEAAFAVRKVDSRDTLGRSHRESFFVVDGAIVKREHGDDLYRWHTTPVDALIASFAARADLHNEGPYRVLAYRIEGPYRIDADLIATNTGRRYTLHIESDDHASLEPAVDDLPKR